jgi:hypothetical protein
LDEVCKSRAERIVLVEGKDDCHVILALAQHYSLLENFGIYECGSDGMVLKRLNALIPSPEPVRPLAIGVVLDKTADRWMQLTRKISPHGYSLPSKPALDGTIVEGDGTNPRVGVWMMPDNVNDGMLEDFLLPAAPPAALEVAREAVSLAKTKQASTFKDAHHSKAVIHTYLAWQDEPGRPLGLSLTCQLLSAETPTAKRFIAWLNRLFR